MVATLEAPKTTTAASADLQELFILLLGEGVLFPKAILPLTLGRAGHIEVVLKIGEGQHIGVVAQRDRRQDDPKLSDLHEIGTVGDGGGIKEKSWRRNKAAFATWLSRRRTKRTSERG